MHIFPCIFLKEHNPLHSFPKLCVTVYTSWSHIDWEGPFLFPHIELLHNLLELSNGSHVIALRREERFLKWHSSWTGLSSTWAGVGCGPDWYPASDFKFLPTQACNAHFSPSLACGIPGEFYFSSFIMAHKLHSSPTF